MSEIKLTAQARTEFGKGAARRIRREHQVPAVVYGHGTDPQHIQLPGHDTMLALKNANALLSIVVGDAKPVLALVKDVQRDPVRQVIEHVDLVIVRRGEKVQVDVPVHVVGEAAPETVVTVENQTLLLEAEATHIPTQVEVSVEGLAAGTQVLAGQLTLPEGSTLAIDDDVLVVNITQQISAEALEAELAEAEAEAGIERDESDEEAAEAQAAEGAAEGEGDAARRRGRRRQGVTSGPTPAAYRRRPTTRHRTPVRTSSWVSATRGPTTRATGTTSARWCSTSSRTGPGRPGARTRRGPRWRRCGSACCPAAPPGPRWCSPSRRRT